MHITIDGSLLKKPASTLSSTLGRSCIGLLIACGLIVVFVPLLLTLYLSIFDEKLILFPPRGYTLAWYAAIWPNFHGAVATTLELAVAVVIGSLLIGVPAGIALSRYRLRGMGVVSALLLAPLTVPGIALGLGDLSVPDPYRSRYKLATDWLAIRSRARASVGDDALGRAAVARCADQP